MARRTIADREIGMDAASAEGQPFTAGHWAGWEAAGWAGGSGGALVAKIG